MLDSLLTLRGCGYTKPAPKPKAGWSGLALSASRHYRLARSSDVHECARARRGDRPTSRAPGMTGRPAPAAADQKSVQDYIDEAPVWQDGTPLSMAPITAMQWRIWCLATAGKFFEGFVVFMTGVALPLIAEEFGLSAVQHGVVGAAPLVGILLGASVLGGLADHYGRKLMFIVEMAIFTAFLALVSASPSFGWLVVCLLGVGIALGCDYPTAHLVISESIPSRTRGRFVLGAFAFQAVGALAGTGIGALILVTNPDVEAWRWMYATAVLPAILVLFGRFFITQSAHWLLLRGRTQDAEREMQRLLRREPPYPKHIRLRGHDADCDASATPAWQGYRLLFTGKYRRATILASVPWFLQDVATYGIGIFTPTILADVFGHGTEHARNMADVVATDILAAKGAAAIDVLLIVGMIAAVFLTDVVGRIRLQTIGFVGCAIGLLVASLSLGQEGSARTALMFTGFLVFNFMTNLGPNAQTYLLSGEVFPTALRGKGAGFAAAFAKIGAATTAFLFPILLADIGTATVLCILAGTSALGALITRLFRIETKGLNLERLDSPDR
jgi:putative MFS transporter